MLTEFTAGSATQFYLEGLQQLRISGIEEQSRGGRVTAMPDIVVARLTNPRRRVIDDPIRDANPFFHLMEFVWMMAGRNDAEWISRFNPRMASYAESNGRFSAAYGHRWRRSFRVDQIKACIDTIKKDRTTRRAVISMWDPTIDTTHGFNDYPCNTTIMFRDRRGLLDMTVCNRSNDFVWGMSGANIVHMTLLHELVAHFSESVLGHYKVMSNNMHIYHDMPRYDEIRNQIQANEIYQTVNPIHMFEGGETYEEFVAECSYFCSEDDEQPSLPWLEKVAQPVYEAWIARKAGLVEVQNEALDSIVADDWRIACKNWISRREIS